MRYIRGLAALVALSALVAGPPAALARFIGWPLPGAVPTWEQLRTGLAGTLTNQMLLDTLACVCWLIWALFTLGVLAEATAAIRGKPAPRVPVVRLVQPLAAALLGAVVLTLVPAGTRPTEQDRAQTLAAALTPVAHAETMVNVDSREPLPARPEQHKTAATDRGQHELATTSTRRTYTVEEGDTLWDIAAARLGDGERWHDIYRLNRGRPQPDGRALTDPDLIYPGWRLLLPRGPGHEPAEDHPDERGAASRSSARGPVEPEPPVTRDHESARRQPTPGTSNPGTSSAPENDPSPHPQQDGTSAQTPPEKHTSERTNPPAAIHLPSGTLVGLSIAAAVSAALAAARAHRRRRHVPPPAGAPPAAADPPTSRLRRDLRQAHLDWLAAQPHGADSPASTTTSQESTSAEVVSSEPPGQTASPPAVLEPPGRLRLAEKDNREVAVDVADLGGLGLDGPRAADVTRAVLVGLLARPPHQRVETVIPRAEATQLLGTSEDDMAAFEADGLTVVPTLDDGLSYLETQLTYRARLLEETDASDVTALRGELPAEPLPSLVLIGAADPENRRAAAILRFGPTYDITGLLLGRWPHGATCQFDEEKRVVAVHGREVPGLAGARLFHLQENDMGDLRELLRAAHGGVDDSTPQPEQPAPANLPDPHGSAEGIGGSQQREDDTERHQCPAPAVPSPPPAAAGPSGGSRPVRISVFGPSRVEAGGEEITTGLRRRARDLLAYLALNAEGASMEAIIDAFDPDHNPTRETERIRAAVRNTRQVLRKATGIRQGMFVVHARGRYRLDPTTVDTDLWQFQRALHEAAQAGDDQTRADALARATETYHDEVLPDAYYAWVEPAREGLRRQAADALSQLAQLVEDGDADRALACLDRAMTFDPYSEELYRRVMRIQARLDRPDAVRRTYRLLETRLDDLDVEPDEQTENLITQLLHPPPRSSRQDPRVNGRESAGARRT